MNRKPRVELSDLPEVIDDGKWYPTVWVAAPLQVVVMIVRRLPKVELDLELGCLCDYLVRNGINLAWDELGVVPRVLIELFSVVQHLVDDTPLRNLLNVHIEDILRCGAVDATNLLLDDLHVVESASHQICGEVHRGCNEDLLSWVEHEHVRHYSCKHLGLAGAWRALDESDSLAARARNCSLLTRIVFTHSVGVELKGEVIWTVERPLRTPLPDAVLDSSLAIRHEF